MENPWVWFEPFCAVSATYFPSNEIAKPSTICPTSRVWTMRGALPLRSMTLIAVDVALPAALETHNGGVAFGRDLNRVGPDCADHVFFSVGDGGAVNRQNRNLVDRRRG